MFLSDEYRMICQECGATLRANHDTLKKTRWISFGVIILSLQLYMIIGISLIASRPIFIATMLAVVFLLLVSRVLLFCKVIRFEKSDA
jgi:hypothetical protein